MLGTGTEVGKTYVARALADLLVGLSPGPVVALKPVESGVSDLGQTDAALLASASRPPLTIGHAFALAEPVSPHLAARNEEKSISVRSVTEWIHQRLAALEHVHPGTSWLIVETAGGAFTPLNAYETNTSLAQALDPSLWMLVAPDRLGVLHELTATLTALAKVARKPDLVVLNSPAQADASTGSNRAEIERLGLAVVTAAIGRNSGLSGTDRARLIRALDL